MTSHSKYAPIGSKRLISGNWVDRCSDCGSTLVAATLEDLDAMACACPPTPRAVRYVVELNCSMCARTIGAVILPEPRAPIMAPRNLRCGWCGGQPQPGDILSQTVYAQLPKMARSRRGRPPKKAEAA